MTNEEKQKMADAISTKMRSIAEECDENLQFEYDVYKLALAALTAKPVKLPPKKSVSAGPLHGIPALLEDTANVSYNDAVFDVATAIREAGYEVQE